MPTYLKEKQLELFPALFKISPSYSFSLFFNRISFMQRGGVPLHRWEVFIECPMGVWRLPWLSGPIWRTATQPKVFRCRRVPLMCHAPRLTDRFPGSIPYGICQNTWSSPFLSCTPASTTWAGQRGADETAVPLFFNFWFQGKPYAINVNRCHYCSQPSSLSNNFWWEIQFSCLQHVYSTTWKH